MKKEELLSIYSNEAGRLGFKPIADEPYLIEPQPDVFTRLIQAGFLDERPASLIIEEFSVQDLDQVIEDETLELNIVENYNNTARHFGRAVSIPQFFVQPVVELGGTGIDFKVSVIERLIGGRIIPMELFAGGLDLSRESIRELVKKTAQVCYDTEQALKKFTESWLVPEMSVAEYFIRRFQKWHQLKKEQGGGVCNPWPLVKYSREKSMVKFLEALELDDIEMSCGFNKFGNTDLIETDDGRFYILDAKIEAKPYGFLAAAWLWNLVLYGWKSHPEQLFESFKTCLGIFHRVYQANDGFAPAIKYSMFERLYATLEIDLRYKCSPYNQLGDQELESAIQNVTYLMNQIL